MEIAFSDSFKKSFKKRIKSTAFESDFWLKVEKFIEHPFESSLRTHKLSGKLKGAWRFSVAYDIRIVFISQNPSPQKQYLLI